MFNVDDDPQFWTTVEVRVPVDDGHKIETFRARFKVLDDAELERLQTDQDLTAKDLLRLLTTDLGDIVDKDGKAIEFSAGLLDRMIGKQHVRIAMHTAYSKGVVKAAAGNSNGSVAPG